MVLSKGICNAGAHSAFARVASVVFGLGLSCMMVGCAPGEIEESRYVEPDRLYQAVHENISAAERFEIIVDIDHSRLAVAAGSPMPPSHVLIWSDPEIETQMIKANPLVAIDLPYRVLAFEDPLSGQARLVTNRYSFVADRHGLEADEAFEQFYEAGLAAAFKGLPEDVIFEFESNEMAEPGIISIKSPYGFEETEQRLWEVINAQGDTVSFGVVDFKERAEAIGVELKPVRLLLFGGPGPGGKAMKKAPTLGLDAFCQKLLIWEGPKDEIYVSFNDLVALAERQQAVVSLPLKFINRRMKQTLSALLTE